VPFRDPIVAGETLVRDAIRSEGFVTGVTGWSVERDGDAEFNDISIRGDWTIQGADPDDFITGRIVTGIPRIEFARDGVTYALIALSDAQFGERLSIGSLSGGKPNISFMETPDNFIVFGPSVHPGPITVWDDGYLYAGNSVSGTGFEKSDWTPITVISGSAFGSNGPEAKMLPDGTVICRGGISGHSTVAGTQIATLPVGLRPARSGRWVCATEATADNNHIAVTPTGVITIAKAAANNSWFTNLMFSAN
jgi:hypothetical protein